MRDSTGNCKGLFTLQEAYYWSLRLWAPLRLRTEGEEAQIPQASPPCPFSRTAISRPLTHFSSLLPSPSESPVGHSPRSSITWD